MIKLDNQFEKTLNEATWNVAQWPKWKRSIDNKDGEVVWIGGERWYISKVQEIRMMDLAPELEKDWIESHKAIARKLGMKDA